MERRGFVCVVQNQAFCALILSLPTTGSMIPGQGHFPSLRFPMQQVGTIGIHRRLWAWQPKQFGGRRQTLPSATGTKALLLTISPNGPNRTLLPKHTGAWQPGQMAIRTEGVECQPGSRRPCSLFPVLPVLGPQLSPAFGESQGRMVTLSWMCQWSNLEVQAVPCLFWVSFFPSGSQSGWWQESHP